MMIYIRKMYTKMGSVSNNVTSTMNTSLRENKVVKSSMSNYVMPIIRPMYASEKERLKLTKKHAEDCEFREIRAGKWNKLTFEEKLEI